MVSENERTGMLRKNPEKVSQAVLAKKFGVSQPTISAVIIGKTWSHL